jgi:hypothetical protein
VRFGWIAVSLSKAMHTIRREVVEMPKDEAYVIDLCDYVLGLIASRHHLFDFLRGDTGRKLPVDAYYASICLAIEYRERQHWEAVHFWDCKQTASGISRGRQRQRYDQRRREELPRHGVELVEFDYHEFKHDGNKRLLRTAEDDERIVRAKLALWTAEPY